MEPTLEVRWFLPGPLPPEAEEWFASLGPAPSSESRTDRYLVPAESDDLGLKLREGRVEAKQRTSSWGRREGAAGGLVEAWRKWSLGVADEPPETGWLDIAKTRRQRAAVLLGTGARCSLELAEVAVGGARWWSVCLEASGASSRERWALLRAGARRWRLGTLPLPPSASMGYPAWLRRVAR